MSLREKILTAEDRSPLAVDVPEWGVTVYVRPLSLAQRVAIAGAGKDVTDAHFVVQGLYDADGERVFTPDDVAALQEKHGAVLSRLAKLVIDQSGLSGDQKN